MKYMLFGVMHEKSLHRTKSRQMFRALISAKKSNDMQKRLVKRFFKACDTTRGKFSRGGKIFLGDSEIIALGGASNETKDRPLG